MKDRQYQYSPGADPPRILDQYRRKPAYRPLHPGLVSALQSKSTATNKTTVRTWRYYYNTTAELGVAYSLNTVFKERVTLNYSNEKVIGDRDIFLVANLSNTLVTITMKILLVKSNWDWGQFKVLCVTHARQEAARQLVTQMRRKYAHEEN